MVVIPDDGAMVQHWGPRCVLGEKTLLINVFMRQVIRPVDASNPKNFKGGSLV
jgi:hypothetical protein